MLAVHKCNLIFILRSGFSEHFSCHDETVGVSAAAPLGNEAANGFFGKSQMGKPGTTGTLHRYGSPLGNVERPCSDKGSREGEVDCKWPSRSPLSPMVAPCRIN